MRAAGVMLDADRAALSGFVYLTTDDAEVAAQFGMHDESQV